MMGLGFNTKAMIPLLSCVLSLAAANSVERKPVHGNPRITHIRDYKPHSFLVYWEAPRRGNEHVDSYELQWRHANRVQYTSLLLIEDLTNPMSARITGLEPYTQYFIRVRAKTDGEFGDYCSEFPAITDVEGPSAPETVNVTVTSPTEILVQWERPETIYKRIDKYVIRIRSVSGEVLEEKESYGDNTEILLTDIPTDHVYKLKVAGSTDSIFSYHSYLGEFSNEVEFELEDTGDVDEDCQECVVNGEIHPPNSDFTIHFNNCYRVFCRCSCQGHSHCYDWSKMCIE